MTVSDLFWNATIEEQKKGFTQDEDNYICLLCGRKIEKGIIYIENGIYYEAEKYMKIHIEKTHQSVFDHIVNLDKKLTGLSEHQTGLIRLFHQGKSDAEVQKEMGIGSASTIRNHRFALREKERQARVFLLMMELMKAKDSTGNNQVRPHKTAKMVDDRYNITHEESAKILGRLFPEGTEGPLKTFAVKEKYKVVVLREIAKRFKVGQAYNEKEVNAILQEVHEEDYVTLRRYLIEYGFLDRKADGSQYWVKGVEEGKEEKNLDRRAELKQQYKEIKTEAGVYQIKNQKTGKILIESTLNLKTINGRRIELERGTHRNRLLQEEIRQFGPYAFTFEVLEVLEKKEDDEFFDVRGALKKLEEKWVEKLKPFGDRGYHKEK